MAREITDNFAVNAAVCMSRYASPPRLWSVQFDQGEPIDYEVQWEIPTVAQLRACANQDDATRDGAYALALAAAEVHLGYLALRRAEGRSGVDFYMIPSGADIDSGPEYDIDRLDLIGLEVSGISGDSDSTIRSRVQRKIEQVRAGSPSLPSVVGVVGFRSARIMFRTV
jgi:hypothetical protein